MSTCTLNSGFLNSGTLNAPCDCTLNDGFLDSGTLNNPCSVPGGRRRHLPWEEWATYEADVETLLVLVAVAEALP